MLLNDVKLVDLYLGEHEGKLFADVKVTPGADAPREPLPAAVEAEVEELRARCEATYANTGHPEFSLLHGTPAVRYRVTAFDNPTLGAPYFTLSRVAARIFPLASVNLPAETEQWLLRHDSRGLVLFCGAMSSGKTSSSGSIMSARLCEHGGLAMALEDPIETLLDGMHGQGRCMQIEVSRHNGGYLEGLTKVLRARVGTVLVGEIRPGPTAERVLSLASTDHLVFSTIHAASPAAAIWLLFLL